MIQYSSDFGKRDIIENTLMQSNKEKGRCLTQEKVLESLRYLNENQLNAYQTAIGREHDNPQRLAEGGTDLAEERFQISVHIAMAKARDKLFIEDGVSEADIDTTIKQLQLEGNPEFQKLMRDTEQALQDCLNKNLS